MTPKQDATEEPMKGTPDETTQTAAPPPYSSMDPPSNTSEKPTEGTLNATSPPPPATSTAIRRTLIADFPDAPRPGSQQIPATIPNTIFLLNLHDIRVRYNVISKKLVIDIPNYSGSPDNADNAALSVLFSLSNLYGIPTGHLGAFLETIGNQNPVNPVAEWILSKPWDGVDRLGALSDTLVHREGFPEPLKVALVHRWLIGAVAAALKPAGFHSRGVLTLQGDQGIGKTRWFDALVPDPVLRECAIKLDHHLDPSNKDSVLTALGHWIVELGELEGSFKRDIARLKGFITNDRDKIRRPYGRLNSEYQRRTVFCASVNDFAFLIDTSNTRWWTIPLTAVNWKHGIDMQMLFSQVAVDFRNGEPWWLPPAEEKCLEEFNDRHRGASMIREALLEIIDLSRVGEPGLKAYKTSELLPLINIHNPTNGQFKEISRELRKLLGTDSTRIGGSEKWRVPLKVHKNDSDDDLY